MKKKLIRRTREAANELCSRQEARDTPEGCRCLRLCSLINAPRCLFFFSILPFSVHSDHHSVSSRWTLPVVYNFLSIFIFSLAPFSNIFPSAVPHLLPTLPPSPLSRQLMPVTQINSVLLQETYLLLAFLLSVVSGGLIRVTGRLQDEQHQLV